MQHPQDAQQNVVVCTKPSISQAPLFWVHQTPACYRLAHVRIVLPVHHHMNIASSVHLQIIDVCGRQTTPILPTYTYLPTYPSIHKSLNRCTFRFFSFIQEQLKGRNAGAYASPLNFTKLQTSENMTDITEAEASHFFFLSLEVRCGGLLARPYLYGLFTIHVILDDIRKTVMVKKSSSTPGQCN